MATKDTVVQELVVNTLTQAQFDAAKKAGTLSPYELYGTPDASVRLPVLTPMWFDHITNDVSWLRADTFSWQSGDVYVAAYNHLAEEMPKPESVQLYCWKGEHGVTVYEEVYTKSPTPDFTDGFYYMWGGELFFESSSIEEVGDGYIEDINGKFYNRYSAGDMVAELPIETHKEVVSGITITYYQAEDGHKICLPDQESNIVALYESTGVAWYYLLDTANKQFKLPRSKHNKYASTLPVAGNGMNLGLTDGTTNIGFGFKTSDQSLKGRTDFYGADVGAYGALGGVASAAASGYSFGVTTDPEKSGVIATQEQDSDQYKYLYFYVGNFTQDSVEQTAGITSETLNSKLDISAGNATDETKATIVGWGMPDYDSGVSISTSTGGTFTVPTDCCIYGSAGSNSRIGVYKDSSSGARLLYLESTGADTATDHAFVAKGTKLYVAYRNGSYATLIYYPLKGAN